MKHLWLVLMCVFLPVIPAGAEDVGIILTGRTHAMIYPCSCPLEPAGGVARRATAIKEFGRSRVPYVLVDAGDCFAGGAMDQYTQGAELDKARTAFNLKAMAAMGYDCVALGKSELNFGWDFFRAAAAAARIPFVCCNISGEGITPFIVKKTGSLLVGITAIAPESLQKKIPGAAYSDPAQALRDTVKALKERRCALVVLLSNLDENESLQIARDVPGIDVLILNKPANENIVNEKDMLVLKSAWQGRRISEAVLSIGQGIVEGMKLTETVLSAKVADDKEVGALVPRCFSDAHCAMPGKIGKCLNPGKESAQCSFVPAPPVRALVIDPQECFSCNTDSVLKGLSSSIPGLQVNRIPYPGPEAEGYLKKFGIHTLPAYLLGKEIENEKAFARMKGNLEPSGDFYRLKPSAAGFGYFVGRPFEDRIDVFMSLYDPDMPKLLENLEEFTPEVHFLAREEEGAYKAPHGKAEIEEDLRSVCVKKYYPGFFYGYLTCRAADPESSWWDKCLEGPDAASVRACAVGNEGQQLLRENIALTAELEINDGPTYLLRNREIFRSVRVPSKEELRKILIRK